MPLLQFLLFCLCLGILQLKGFRPPQQWRSSLRDYQRKIQAIQLQNNNDNQNNKNSPEEVLKSIKPTLRGAEWARIRGLDPGYGGIWPGDPNAKQYKVTIRAPKSGKEYVSMVPEDRYIFFYFEEQGIDLPIINKERMCRQGCCTTCTVKLIEGKGKLEGALGIAKQFQKEGYTLSCCTYPKSDIICEIQDEDELYVKQFGESFGTGEVEWGGVLPEEE